MGLKLSGTRQRIVIDVPKHLRPLKSAIYTCRIIVHRQDKTHKTPAKVLTYVTIRQMHNRL